MKFGDDFRCDACGKVFKSESTDGEMMAEAKSLWREEDLVDSAIVCDGCFQNIMAQEAPHPATSRPECSSG